ncbi:hypothetical protein [Geofilum rhodophaeum]|uniref:hypothetical protein n=1 Tax=Geofilum rhodophaeum TaxID=1965019 RepID=UPI00197AF366|nr:hypothetical protein [Geofilum rhodophaeum]
MLQDVCFFYGAQRLAVLPVPHFTELSMREQPLCGIGNDRVLAGVFFSNII